MDAAFAPSASAGLRKSFARGPVARRRPPTRTGFPTTRCCALEQSGSASDAALQITEGSMGNTGEDEMLLAALDRDWDVLEDFGGALADPVFETPSLAERPDGGEGDAKNEADVLEGEANNAEEVAPPLQAISEAEVPVARQGGGESDDVAVAIAEASTVAAKGARGAKSKTKAKAKPATKRKTAAQKKAETQEESDRLAAAALWDRDPKWFFLQTKPGCEQSCAISLRNLAACMPSLHISDVMVPAMKIMRLTKAGTTVKKEERIYPSYILIHMVMSQASYGEVRAVPNVQFFMGDPNRDKKKNQPFMPPLPVSESELRNVFHRMRTAELAKPESKTELRPGNMVRIVEGEYAGRYATITEVRPDFNSINARLRLFARDVDMEFAISEVVKEDPPLDFDDFDEEGEPKKEADLQEESVDASASTAQNDDDASLWPNEEEAGAVSTVLDTLENLGSAGPAPAGKFDDLLGDDLPQFLDQFDSNPKKSPPQAKPVAQDPVQDLLDMFGADVGADSDPVDEAATDADASSGFAEAEVLPDGDEASGEADRWV